MNTSDPNFIIILSLIIVFVAVIVLILLYNNMDQKYKTDLPYDNRDEDKIKNACMKYVSQSLKSPSSAQFPSINIKSLDKYGRVFVDISVDSQNSFGAMLRTNFGVVLYPKNNEYCVTDSGVCKYGFYKTEDTIKQINNWNKPL